MGRRSFGRFCKENRFWFLLISIAIIIISGLQLAFYFLDKQELPQKNNFSKKFTSCFDGRVIFTCGEKDSSKKHCAEDIKKHLNITCSKMEKLGVGPLEKVRIDVRSPQWCDHKKSRCASYFFRTNGTIDGYRDGYIYLPPDIIGDEVRRSYVLPHEIAHSFTSKHWYSITRIVDEFFAMYTQVKLSGFKRLTCNGKEWNQPALASFGGDYISPKKGARLAISLNTCRYGQLEYLTRLLDERFPKLYKKLWEKLEKHKKGAIDIKRLKEWIKEIDEDAWKIASDFYILKQTDSRPHIVWINERGLYCFFVYRSVSPKKEDYFENAYVCADCWRNGKQLEHSFGMNMNYTCLDGKKIRSGDSLRVMAVFGGKKLLKKIIIP